MQLDPSSKATSDIVQRMGARVKKVRRVPPPSVRDEVLREAGYKCANPACRNILTLQLHHMVWVKAGGGNQPTNLIALCGHCHDLHTQGHIPLSAIRHWKGLLHALNYAFNKESMDLLLYLNRPSIENVWYTSNGLLRFAGLIAAGLVDIVASQFSVGVRYGDSAPTSPPTTSVRISLTDKGKLLVDSWLRGDEAGYRSALERVVPGGRTARFRKRFYGAGSPQEC